MTNTAQYLVLGLAFFTGWVVNGWRHQAEIDEIHRSLAEARTENITQTREKEHLQQQLVDSLAVEFETSQAKIEVVTQTVEKEVIRYEESPTAGQCHLSNGWVRIDTHAAAGMPTDTVTTSEFDDAFSGFTDIDLLGVTTERSAIYHQEVAKLSALREFVRTQCVSHVKTDSNE